jgi:hypothetical protein
MPLLLGFSELLEEIWEGKNDLARRPKSPWDRGDPASPPSKKSCLDKMRNALARTAAQIRTDHWRSAVYLKRIRKMVDDKCWFCQGLATSYFIARIKDFGWLGRRRGKERIPEVSGCCQPIPGGSGGL